MKKWIVSILILILLTGCTNQNPVQTTQENTTDIRTMDQTENESEEISASLLEESVTVEKLQADSEKNLAQMQKEQTVYTTQCINLYQEPSLESDVMAIIGSGDALKQIGVQNEWIKVDYCEQEYYAQGNYVTKEKPKNAFSVSHEGTIHTLTTEQIAEIGNLDAEVKGYGSGKERDQQNRPLMPISLQEYYRGKNYNITFIGDNTKYVFLTFDMGWEYSNDGIRNTEKLLDILKEKNVRAAFFVTHEYANRSKDLVERMIKEGHVVGSHGYSHPDNGIPSLPLNEQIEDTVNMQNYVKDTFQYDMYMYRFSSSYYSDMSLAMVNAMGYHTSFWSVESIDWLVDEQPDPAQLMEEYINELHPGAVYMMHAVSNSNIEIMSKWIDQVREAGYEFGYYCR